MYLRRRHLGADLIIGKFAGCRGHGIMASPASSTEEPEEESGNGEKGYAADDTTYDGSDGSVVAAAVVTVSRNVTSGVPSIASIAITTAAALVVSVVARVCH